MTCDFNLVKFIYYQLNPAGGNQVEDKEELKTESPNKDQNIVEITYQGINGIKFEYTDPTTNERWIQQVVGEHMLDVRWKQFDRYCGALEPKVEKRRIKTKRYSYNFIKESDVHRMAKAFNKVVRIPIKDIPRTDENEKIFSKTDVGSMVEGEVNHRGMAIFNEYKEIIKNLESRNETLHTEVNSLVKEKYTVLSKLKNWQITAVIVMVILVAGGGVAAYFVYTTNKDNDRLYDEKRQASAIITTLNAENSNLNLKTKMEDDEIEILKKQVPAIQNTEINTVKKD